MIESPTRSDTVLLSYAFRPLFLLATLHALLSLSFWIAWWGGLVPVTIERIPMYWHGHEMIMGLAAAAIGGFLLTAVATWTKRPPVSGVPLLLLCMAWLVGRFALQWPWLALFADLAYWLGLWSLLAIELFSARNSRNYKLLWLLAAMTLSDLLFHLAELYQPVMQQRALWAQIWLVILLINVIGGRIIPAFTTNWLRKQEHGAQLTPAQLPHTFGTFDLVAIAVLVLFALTTVLPVQWPVPPAVAFSLGILATVLQLVRLLRWKFWLTFSDPLVWMLHLSYAWIPVGLALWTLSVAGVVPVSAALHALTVGGITSMIISVGSRAALGHTGRPLRSHPLLTSTIVLLTITAVLRVTAVLVPTSQLLELSAIAWILAFLCFAFVYVPILLTAALTAD